MTNVGNEDGQIIQSVVTSGEGDQLNTMVDGLVDRYRQHGVLLPLVLYLDRTAVLQRQPFGGRLGSTINPSYQFFETG